MVTARASEVFPPGDRVALFVASVAMAANDIQYALQQAAHAAEARNRVAPAARANQSGTTKAEARFSFWHRLVNSFLFEGIDALRGWEQESGVKQFLLKLEPNGKKALRKVRGLQQQTGPKALEHMRHHTFHYPHPDPAKQPDSTAQLAEVLEGMADSVVGIDLGPDDNHRFPFAGMVALMMAAGGHHHHLDPRFEKQAKDLRQGATVFILLARHIFRVYGDERGIGFRMAEKTF